MKYFLKRIASGQRLKSEIELKCDDQWIDLYLGKDILLYEMKNRECYCNDESGKKSNKKKKKSKKKKNILGFIATFLAN